ncbi:MAG: glutathione S-transferase family protein [Bacteroidota bacterium]
MIRLHDNLTSGNGFKIRLLLSQLGISYQRVEYDIDKAETRTPAFLAMNPNGRVPLLELEGGQFLAESDAILWYLADGTPFLPQAPLERAEVLQWMFFEQYSHEPNIATVRFWITHRVEMTADRQTMLPLKMKQGHAALAVMEQHLAARPFFVGGRYSIADVALYAYTHVAGEGGFDLGSYPSVRAWLARVAAQPGYVPITRG